MKEEKIFLFKEYRKKRPNAQIEVVHINKRIIDGYYWGWSSMHKDWVRGEKVNQ